MEAPGGGETSRDRGGASRIMLDGLDRVDWSGLGDAYGPATRIPEFLQSLTSDDPDEWVGGIDGLYMGLCHQRCTVYEATPAAVPFLVGLLAEPRGRCRARILELLGDIAGAGSDLDVHADAVAEQAGDAEEHRRRLRRERSWVRGAREATWRGLDVYLDLLDDPDRKLRLGSLYTLGRLAEFARDEIPKTLAPGDPIGRIAAAMGRRFEEEPDELVRAGLLFGLAGLADARPDVLRPHRRALADPSAAPSVRLAAALALADRLDPVPDEAVRVLAATVDRPDDADSIFRPEGRRMEPRHHPLLKAYRAIGLLFGRNFGSGFDPDEVGMEEDAAFPEWIEEGVVRACHDRLARLGIVPTDAELERRLVPLGAANPYNADGLAAPLLRRVFGDRKVGEGDGPDSLTAAQRRVLQVLFDNPMIWATRMANLHSTFRAHGLSPKRDAWRPLLGIEPRPLSEAEASRVLDRLVRGQLALGEGATVTDADRARIQELILRHLAEDAFPPLLARFPGLKVLELSTPRVTDAGLARLPGLRSLRELDLTGSGLTDASLPGLAGLRTIEVLRLGRTAVTDDGLAALASLEGLACLWLGGTAVTDAGLAHLRGLPKLRELALPSGVTGAVAEHLAAMPSLQVVSLWDAEPTEETVGRVRAALPHALIRT